MLSLNSFYLVLFNFDYDPTRTKLTITIQHPEQQEEIRANVWEWWNKKLE